jgi:hypothetical protein
MSSEWPALPYEDWIETREALHGWSQVVGKIALAHAPPVNHAWGVALQLLPRGLATRLLHHGGRAFTVELDLVDEGAVVRTSDGAVRSLALKSRSVAAFHRDLLALLGELGLPTHVWPVTVEMPAATRFEDDARARAFDGDKARRLLRVLLSTERVLGEARAGFIGKASPVHFFWGSFDLACSRFSGRPAPPREGPAFMREAYSHEVISHGFWPGADAMKEAVFYAYCVPEPEGFREKGIEPAGAAYDTTLGEFLLPYRVVQQSPDPAAALRAFIESTYERGATLAGWDRAALERRPAG